MTAARRTPRQSSPCQSSPRKCRVTFTLHAPDAISTSVVGSFCNWQPDAHPLKKDRRGTWKTAVHLPPGRYEYRFLVDGEWRDDPACTERTSNPFGSENCVLHVLREVAEAGREAVEHVATP